jgi:hypothetical protein
VTATDTRAHETSASRGRAARAVAGLALAVVAAGLLLGLAIGHWRYSPGPFLRRMTMQGEWIRASGAPGYAGYFRRHVSLPGPVKHAWVAVAPMEGFEICVNRNPSGRFYLWRPTRPFQTGLSEGGQAFIPSPAALALNFPREYQWSAHRNDWLPVYLDITPQLKPGANVITVEVESRRAPAMFRLDGEIELWSGERIRIDSDTAWKAEPVPPFDARHDWTDPGYSDLAWRPAVDVARTGQRVPDLHFHAFDERVLTTPFSGSWIRSDEAHARDAVWFEAQWELPSVPDDAWLRLAVNRSFDLFVNDNRVTAPLLGTPDLDSGDWVLGAPRGADLPAAPELLDPDEVGSLFVGERFESPRHGDPSQLAFKTRERTLNVTRDKSRATSRSDLPGTYDPVKEEGEDVMPHDPLPPQPEHLDPKSLGRDRAVGGLLAYNVRALLKPGRNSIRVRLPPPLSPEGLLWAPQLAIDGEARYRDGSRRHFATSPEYAWTVRTQAASGTLGAATQAVILGPALTPGKRWPGTVFRGVAHDTAHVLAHKLVCVGGAGAGVAILAAGLLAMFHDRARRRGLKPLAALDDAARAATRMLLPPILVLLAVQLTKTSWVERHEALLFRLPRVWPCVFIAAALSPLVLTRPMRGLGRAALHLPRTRAWPVLVGCLLVLCGVLRVYKLDFQPLDDDEYASAQAVVGIAETGAPRFVPDGVYYTRSPAYHYLVGAVVRLCGENLWAMRLPSAAFAVATAALMLRFGDRLLHRPWVGFGAALLFSLHPFAIFSAHLVRFYQQQQFFSLLTVYLFCLGFLGRPSQKDRYLTVLAFLVAVLSQEITAVMALQLLLGMFVFGRDAGWRSNLRLAVAGCLAIGFIVLDLAVFQTLCLTRTEGVSPSVEASIKLHFWDPYNVVTIFIGYSRLHLAASLVLAAALPLLLRRGGKVVWALLFFTVTGVLLTNLMVTHVSLRYQYWLIPLWLLLVTRGLGLLAERTAMATRWGGERLADTRALAPLLAAPLFAALLMAWAPWRIVDSYDCKLLGDATGAFRYVRSQLRPGDAVAATEPHPHAAHLEAGRVDYDLTVPLLYDFVMLEKGRLIDRNGGGEVISSLDELMAACKRHERLWIVVNREKFRTRGKNLRWEYPAARIELFLRENCQIAHRDYLWTVFLWDQSRGSLDAFRGQ